MNPGPTQPDAPAVADETRHAEDVAWVREVRQGRAEAFGPIVERHGPRLHAMLRRFFRDPADVDDILQDSLVRAYQNLDRYDPSRALYPWLRKIAVNLALNELERRKRRAEVADPDLALETQVDPARTDTRLREREARQAVERELDAMTPGWAAVFRLRTFEELSYAEIAETLDVPIGTVMSQLARARRRLAEALASRFGPPGRETS